jgi:hypothetical protein
MRAIRPCPSCAAPVTLKMTRCPHCNRAHPLGMLARTAHALAAVAGSFTISGTLAACYGAPCADAHDTSCIDVIPSCSQVSSQPAVDDVDRDGYCKAQDCNENDKQFNAAAHDLPGDGLDQNCDGKDALR